MGGYKSDMSGEEIKTAFQGEGTSIFNPTLCEVCYSWFCIDGGKILDPFAGGSVRGIVANYLNFKYTGIDLSGEQIKENIKQGDEILKDKIKPVWITGDSEAEVKKLKEKFDLLFTCPPYFDLEVYSDDKNDISNLDYEGFSLKYKNILTNSINLLNDNSFGIVVISDTRDKRGFYRDLTGLTKDIFLKNDMPLYNDIILINSVGSLPIRVKKMFVNRKVGRRHQNVLVFYKGNPKNIKDKFKKEFNFSKFEESE